MLKKYEAFYQKWSRWIRHYPWAVKAIRLFNRSMTYLYYGIYPIFLGILAYKKDQRLMACILVPAISFLLLSAIRRLINRPRPYIRLQIDPLIHKPDIGDSMPSRHVFSSTMIAMTVLLVFPMAGAILLGLALLLALTRVLAGIHYPTDVTVGFFCGILCGELLFYICR